MNKVLLITDLIFVATVTVIGYSNDDFDKIPVLLKILVGSAFASCIIRHINFYRHTKRIY